MDIHTLISRKNRTLPLDRVMCDDCLGFFSQEEMRLGRRVLKRCRACRSKAWKKTEAAQTALEMDRHAVQQELDFKQLASGER